MNDLSNITINPNVDAVELCGGSLSLERQDGAITLVVNYHNEDGLIPGGFEIAHALVDAHERGDIQIAGDIQIDDVIIVAAAGFELSYCC